MASSRRRWAAGRRAWRCTLLALADGPAVPGRRAHRRPVAGRAAGQARGPARRADEPAALGARPGPDRALATAATCCTATGSTRRAGQAHRRGGAAPRRAGNPVGAAAAARVALGAAARRRAAARARANGPSCAGRARPAGRPGPAGGRGRAARGGRLDGRRGRRRGCAGPRTRTTRRHSGCCCAPTWPGGQVGGGAGRLRDGPASGSPRIWARTPRRRPPRCTRRSCAASCRRRHRRRPPAGTQPGRPRRRAGLPRRDRAARQRRRRRRSSSSTARPASARPRCCAPGRPAPCRRATPCCWRSCGQLDRTMPLDALLSALCGAAAPSRPRGRRRRCSAPTRPCSARCWRPGPRRGRCRPGQDSMLGPAVLYAALDRLLGPLAERGPLILLIDDAHLGGAALPGLAAFRAAGETARHGRRGGPLRRGRAAARHRGHPPGRARPRGRGRAGRAGPGRRALRAVPGPPAVPDRAGAAGAAGRAARLPGRVGVRPLRRAGPPRASCCAPRR